jgi:hypothetical protein
MGRRPERDSSPSTHRCERAAYRQARKPAESSHFLPGIFLQSGRNLRETFMQAMRLRTPNTQVEKITRECQVGTQFGVHLRAVLVAVAASGADRVYHRQGDQHEIGYP